MDRVIYVWRVHRILHGLNGFFLYCFVVRVWIVCNYNTRQRMMQVIDKVFLNTRWFMRKYFVGEHTSQYATQKSVNYTDELFLIYFPSMLQEIPSLFFENNFLVIIIRSIHFKPIILHNMFDLNFSKFIKMYV